MNSYGILYIVATPIGNLKDITIRAVEVLKFVNCIAAEDTRVTKKLLTHFDIHTPVVSCHSYNEKARSGYLIDKLLNGEDIALVSDAGIPVFSDPGLLLVKEAVEKNIKVVPIPGASSITACLMVSGFPTSGTKFLGFLPRNLKKIKEIIDQLNKNDTAAIVFESPNRIKSLLKIFNEIIPDSQVVLCRELTKLHEEILRGIPYELIKKFETKEPKGEFTIFINPSNMNQKENADDLINDPELILETIIEIYKLSLHPKKKAEILAEKLKVSQNKAYVLLKKLKNI